jgi:hypothetical protein
VPLPLWAGSKQSQAVRENRLRMLRTIADAINAARTACAGRRPRAARRRPVGSSASGWRKGGRCSPRSCRRTGCTARVC